MNPVLAHIKNTAHTYTPEGNLVAVSQTSVSPRKGELIQKVIQKIQAVKSLEVGLAYGVSALYICEALVKNSETMHYVIDPYQAQWQDIGIFNLNQAGYSSYFQLLAEPSHLALTTLERQGVEVDFAFIDGYHTFDHALMDFFLIDKILKVGGVVVLDDTNWDSIKKVCSFILQNRNYKVFDAYPTDFRLTWQRKLLNRVFQKLQKINSFKSFINQPANFYGGAMDKVATSGIIALQKQAHDARLWTHFVDF
ncbi:MAG: class I SAM-dependent methyltransferase [Microscillaceae bacterium]|jgi:predicted O-methyltransferase YrrM|nr:class I SAM-dependent methyltransferase [Microscillaceae bacterium]